MYSSAEVSLTIENGKKIDSNVKTEDLFVCCFYWYLKSQSLAKYHHREQFSQPLYMANDFYLE